MDGRGAAATADGNLVGVEGVVGVGQAAVDGHLTAAQLVGRVGPGGSAPLGQVAQGVTGGEEDAEGRQAEEDEGGAYPAQGVAEALADEQAQVAAAVPRLSQLGCRLAGDDALGHVQQAKQSDEDDTNPGDRLPTDVGPLVEAVEDEERARPA